MNILAKAVLLSGTALLSAGAIALPGTAVAQDAVFVLTARDVGAPSYDPIKGTRLNDAVSLIFDRLVVQDTDQSYHGLLASSWESTPDGMQWTFKLRPGVKFHNGEPFNAKTIEWWIPKFKGTENSFMIDSIAKVEVIDDLTVRFVMKTPDPNMLFNLASTFMGVPEPKTFDRLGDKFGVTEAVGTGPFKLEKFTVGQQTVLVRNDDYKWASDLSTNKGPAKIKNLEIREIAEDSTAFLELQTGGVDLLLKVPTDFLPRLQSQKAVKIVTLPGTEIIYMPINTSVEPFTDINVRQATALAVNSEGDHRQPLRRSRVACQHLSDQLLAGIKSRSEVQHQLRPRKGQGSARQVRLDDGRWRCPGEGREASPGEAVDPERHGIQTCDRGRTGTVESNRHAGRHHGLRCEHDQRAV